MWLLVLVVGVGRGKGERGEGSLAGCVGGWPGERGGMNVG
jgi:hypothetical protein